MELVTEKTKKSSKNSKATEKKAEDTKVQARVKNPKVDETVTKKTAKETPTETKPTKEDKKSKKIKKATKSITRIKATVMAMANQPKKSDWTTDSLAIEADKIYADAGGKANLKEAKWTSWRVIQIVKAQNEVNA
jgi:hypothetical protein